MPYSYDKFLTIDEPHLIERYERALLSFGFKAPGLKSFRIDMIGFSPEVAEALGDIDYLDPNRVNRRFIIVSPEQANLPVVHSSFSNTQDLMAEFFEKNRRVLFALTIKDVVFGEIEDSVFEIDDINDLLSIEMVEFKISTHENLTAKTADLKGMIDRLLKEPDAWRDDAMLKKMVSISKQTGDIRDNELMPDEVVFVHQTFWAAHFSGVYVFNDDEQITVICDPSAKGFRKSRPWQVSYLDINDQRNVYKFLEETDRLQPPLGSWVERSGLLDLRVNMAAAWLAADQGDDAPTSIINKTWVRRWKRENRPLVREDGTIPLLEWAEEQVEHWSNIDMDDVEHGMRFCLCRANPEHQDFRLVNRLISRYLPFDFISRFEFNRPNFLRDKQEWSEERSEFVAMALENYYLKDHDGLYERLYF